MPATSAESAERFILHQSVFSATHTEFANTSRNNNTWRIAWMIISRYPTDSWMRINRHPIYCPFAYLDWPGQNLRIQSRPTPVDCSAAVSGHLRHIKSNVQLSYTLAKLALSLQLIFQMITLRGPVSNCFPSKDEKQRKYLYYANL